MSAPVIWPEPKWLADLPDSERERARVRYILCIAVAYAADKASPADLSRFLGMNRQSMHLMKHRGQVSAECAVKLESLLGREHFPRELFRPDLFLLPAE